MQQTFALFIPRQYLLCSRSLVKSTKIQNLQRKVYTLPLEHVSFSKAKRMTSYPSSASSKNVITMDMGFN